MDASRRADIRKGDEFSCGVAFGHKKTLPFLREEAFYLFSFLCGRRLFLRGQKMQKKIPLRGAGEENVFLFLSCAEAVPVKGAGGAAGAVLTAAFPDAAEGPEEVEHEDGEDAHGGGHGSLLRGRGGLSGRPRR